MRIILSLLAFSFLFLPSSITAGTMEEARVFLKHMKGPCGGENKCYNSLKEDFLKDVELGGALYFACRDQYAQGCAKNLSFEPCGRCLSDGVKGLISYFREINDDDTANYLRRWIEDCETWGGYHSQFKCYKNYLKEGKGKYID